MLHRDDDVPLECFKDGFGFVHLSGIIDVVPCDRFLTLEPRFCPARGLQFVVDALCVFDEDGAGAGDSEMLRKDVTVQVYRDGSVVAMPPFFTPQEDTLYGLDPIASSTWHLLDVDVDGSCDYFSEKGFRIRICLDPIHFLAFDHEQTVRRVFPSVQSPGKAIEEGKCWEKSVVSYYLDRLGFVRLFGIVRAPGGVSIANNVLFFMPGELLPMFGDKFRCSVRLGDGRFYASNLHLHRDGALYTYRGEIPYLWREISLDGIVYLPDRGRTPSRHFLLPRFTFDASTTEEEEEEEPIVREESNQPHHFTPMLQSGFHNWGWNRSTVTVVKDASGRVRLLGMVEGSAHSVPILTLPREYRPRAFCRFTSQAYYKTEKRGGITLIISPETGAVVLANGGHLGLVNDFSLCNVSFDPEVVGDVMGEEDGSKKIMWACQKEIVQFTVVTTTRNLDLRAFKWLLFQS